VSAGTPGTDRPEDLQTPHGDAVREFLSGVVEPQRTGVPAGLDSTVEDLVRAGTEAGRPVLVALPNGVSLLTTVFAVLLTGAVPVPVSPAAGSPPPPST
jgi:hypothetical protein